MNGTRQCPECQKPFQPVKPWQRFDTPKCRDRWHSKRRNARRVKARVA